VIRRADGCIVPEMDNNIGSSWTKRLGHLLTIYASSNNCKWNDKGVQEDILSRNNHAVRRHAFHYRYDSEHEPDNRIERWKLVCQTEMRHADKKRIRLSKRSPATAASPLGNISDISSEPFNSHSLFTLQ